MSKDFDLKQAVEFSKEVVQKTGNELLNEWKKTESTYVSFSKTHHEFFLDIVSLAEQKNANCF